MVHSLQAKLWLLYLKMRNRLHTFLEWAQTKAEYFEVLFLTIAIYIVAIFLGAPTSWLTFLFSVSVYFLTQEFFYHCKETVRGLFMN